MPSSCFVLSNSLSLSPYILSTPREAEKENRQKSLKKVRTQHQAISNKSCTKSTLREWKMKEDWRVKHGNYCHAHKNGTFNLWLWIFLEHPKIISDYKMSAKWEFRSIYLWRRVLQYWEHFLEQSECLLFEIVKELRESYTCKSV